MASVVFGFKKSQGPMWLSGLCPRGQRWHNGGPGPRKNHGKWEGHKPKVKVMELSNTRQVHTACKGGVTLRWHTPLSRPFNRRKLCKNEGKAMQNFRKHTGEPKKQSWKMLRHKPKVKVKTYMELSNTRQVHTACIWGWHTKMAHRNWRSCLECVLAPGLILGGP